MKRITDDQNIIIIKVVLIFGKVGNFKGPETITLTEANINIIEAAGFGMKVRKDRSVADFGLVENVNLTTVHGRFIMQQPKLVK